MSGERYLLDTNIVVRFLTQDDPVQSRQVNALFHEASSGKCVLVLTEVAIAETVWVLQSTYKLSRRAVSDSLLRLIGKQGVRAQNIETIWAALTRYQSTNCDYLDCHLAAMAADSGDSVASFDKDLRKFKDIRLWDYASIM